MKLNWKMLLGIAVIVGVAVWAVTSLAPKSFSGSNLTFNVGSGAVSINNTSDVPVLVQLIGTGTRAFAVSGTIEDVVGSSTREGTGSSATQLFEFAALPGLSEFTVVRGNNVKFVSTTDTSLNATVQPLSQDETRTTLIVAAIVVLGSLYFISRATGHSWINALRRKEIPVLTPAAVVETPVGDPNRGRDGRMYSNYGNKD